MARPTDNSRGLPSKVRCCSATTAWRVQSQLPGAWLTAGLKPAATLPMSNLPDAKLPRAPGAAGRFKPGLSSTANPIRSACPDAELSAAAESAVQPKPELPAVAAVVPAASAATTSV